MSENTVYVKRYTNQNEAFPLNENEVWRYAGYYGHKEAVDEHITEMLQAVIAETIPVLDYKVCYRRCNLSWQNHLAVLPFPTDCKAASIQSQDLSKCLKDCEEVIMFAATIGIGIDRLIAKYQRISPVKALLLQAYGAERIESVCDVFCEEIKEQMAQEGYVTTPRFSPGYGDLPLMVQTDMFQLLDCNRQIGISLNDSLLMTPTKSVTAIFGLKRQLGD